MANMNEIVVETAVDAASRVVKNGGTWKVIAKYGLIGVAGAAAIVGVYVGVKKVAGLFNKPQKALSLTAANDATSFVPDELEPINDK